MTNPTEPRLITELRSSLAIMRSEIKSLQARSLEAIATSNDLQATGLERCTRALQIEVARVHAELRLVVEAVLHSQPLMAEVSQPSGVRHRVGCTRTGATLSHYRTGPTCEHCGVTG